GRDLRAPLHQGAAGPGPHHPVLRRAAAVRVPHLAERLHRVLLLRGVLARLPADGLPAGAARVRGAQPPLREVAGARCGGQRIQSPCIQRPCDPRATSDRGGTDADSVRVSAESRLRGWAPSGKDRDAASDRRCLKGSTPVSTAVTYVLDTSVL